MAWIAWKRCCKKVYSQGGVFTIDFSKTKSIVNHNSQSDGQHKRAKSGMNLHKKIIHTNSLQRNREDTKDNGILLWTKQTKMGLRNFDLILEPRSRWKNRLHHESGEQVEERLHPNQQRRWHSSWSASWWDKSGWNWKWAHNFFSIDFCYSWFSFTVDSDSLQPTGSVDRNTSHVFLLMHLARVFTPHLAQGVSVRISLHPHAIHDVTCLSVRLLSLRVSLFPVFSHFYLTSFTVYLFSAQHTSFYVVTAEG